LVKEEDVIAAHDVLTPPADGDVILDSEFQTGEDPGPAYRLRFIKDRAAVSAQMAQPDLSLSFVSLAFREGSHEQATPWRILAPIFVWPYNKHNQTGRLFLRGLPVIL
jgi:hypothetical protein